MSGSKIKSPRKESLGHKVQFLLNVLYNPFRELTPTRGSSIISWSHVNLNGEYDFTKEQSFGEDLNLDKLKDVEIFTLNNVLLYSILRISYFVLGPLMQGLPIFQNKNEGNTHQKSGSLKLRIHTFFSIQ